MNKLNIKNNQNILLKYEISNGDYGFFSEYKEIYFDKKGVKIGSSLENISYSLKEFDFYLLENKKIAKFLRHDTLHNPHRELFEIYSITKYKNLYRGKSILKEFLKLEKELQKKTA